MAAHMLASLFAAFARRVTSSLDMFVGLCFAGRLSDDSSPSYHPPLHPSMSIPHRVSSMSRRRRCQRRLVDVDVNPTSMSIPHRCHRVSSMSRRQTKRRRLVDVDVNPTSMSIPRRCRFNVDDDVETPTWAT